MNSKKISDIINNLLEEVNDEDFVCPFCGAREEFIDTYDLEDDEEVIGTDNDDEVEVITPDPSIEFHCMTCNKWWIYDKDGEEYEIPYDDESHREEQNMTGDPAIPIDSFKKFYEPGGPKGISFGNTPPLGMPSGGVYSESADENVNEIKGRRVRKRARRRTKAKGRLANMKKARKQNRKASQRKRLSKRVGSSKTKKVVWRDGKYVVVKKDFRGRVKNTEELIGLRMSKVRRLDETFELRNWLVKLVESSDNPSNFEQACSNYIKKNDVLDFDTFLESIQSKFNTEYNQLKIIKANFSSVNESLK